MAKKAMGREYSKGMDMGLDLGWGWSVVESGYCISGSSQL